jgi:cathepsin D
LIAPRISLTLFTAANVNGQNIVINQNSALSAIDTGTTLIGGPSDDVQAIYAAIPNSQALTGEMAGFYQYRELNGECRRSI